MTSENELEQRVAGAWAEVLELDQVGLDDDFLKLGGSSLDAVRIVGRLEEDLAVELSVRAVLETRTVRKMTGRVREAVRAGREGPHQPPGPTFPGPA
jgi:acyl carrier protein